MNGTTGELGSMCSNVRAKCSAMFDFAMWVSIVASLLSVLVGCSDTAPEVTDEKLQVFELSIQKRSVAVSGGAIRVFQGQQVEMRLQADEGVTVHLHGYDISASLEPGIPVVWNFRAHATGRFAIEAHDFGDTLAATPSHGNHGEEPHEHSNHSGVDSTHGESSSGEATEKTLLYFEVHPR